MSVDLQLPTPTTRPTPPAVPRRPRRRPRWWLWGLLALLALALLLGLSTLLSQPSASGTPTVTPVPAVRASARGRVQPVAQARVSTIGGGVIVRLNVVAGEAVTDQQEIARVRTTGGVIETLTAPWAGTITSVPVRFGDTVMPGTLVATLGDLSRLQIETTDVDEFIIGRVQLGRPVRLVVDALDQREIAGYVERIALVPEATTGGDTHYPVVIGLVGQAPELRPGMSVRVRFAE